LTHHPPNKNDLKIKTLIVLVAASCAGPALADGIALRSSYGLQKASTGGI